jgi:hypothetical protein
MTTARRPLVLAHGDVGQANPTARAQRGKGGPARTGLPADARRAVDGGRKANLGREAH